MATVRGRSGPHWSNTSGGCNTVRAPRFRACRCVSWANASLRRCDRLRRLTAGRPRASRNAPGPLAATAHAHVGCNNPVRTPRSRPPGQRPRRLPAGSFPQGHDDPPPSGARGGADGAGQVRRGVERPRWGCSRLRGSRWGCRRSPQSARVRRKTPQTATRDLRTSGPGRGSPASAAPIAGSVLCQAASSAHTTLLDTPAEQPHRLDRVLMRCMPRPLVASNPASRGTGRRVTAASSTASSR